MGSELAWVGTVWVLNWGGHRVGLQHVLGVSL